jgi:hypothetical protein
MFAKWKTADPEVGVIRSTSEAMTAAKRDMHPPTSELAVDDRGSDATEADTAESKIFSRSVARLTGASSDIP